MTPPAASWDVAAFRARIQTTLEEFLTEQETRLEPLGPDANRLLAEARQCVTGGKRLRAAFCHWGFQAIRPGDLTDGATRSLARAGAALELLHASALVHDDLMDASDTRRGHPTPHRGFAEQHRRAGWSSSSEQYGAAAAILLGDLLLSWADELLRRCGFSDDRVLAALDVLDVCRSEVITGQFLDVSAQARGSADVTAAMTVLRYKSAKYSVERPLHLGAALAGARPEQIADLSAFGLPLGEAFQLRDDLLGVFGDPEATGKPAGDDLVEGKRTVLVALALDGAGPERAAELEAGLGTALDPAGVTRLREIIDESGAHAQVEQVIGELSEHALVALDRARIDEGVKVVLRELAAATTHRAV